MVLEQVPEHHIDRANLKGNRIHGIVSHDDRWSLYPFPATKYLKFDRLQIWRRDYTTDKNSRGLAIVGPDLA